jgi:hypothetical protein
MAEPLGTPEPQTHRETRGVEPNRTAFATVEQSLAYYAVHPEQIDGRLRELREEWDIERALITNASILSLFGWLAGTLGRRRLMLLLPVAMTALLLQYAIKGWSRPLDFFRNLGMRTREEIALEYNALRALRGDFEPIGPAPEQPPTERIARIVSTLHW